MVVILSGFLTMGPRLRERSSSASAEANPIKISLDGARITESVPATADFDGDGLKEIVVGGSDGILHIVSFDGSTWREVWTHQTNDDINAANPPNPGMDNNIRSSPAIADLDNDGHLDIIVAVGGDVHVPYSERRNGGVLVYRYNSAWDFSLLEPLAGDGSRGWPQPRIDQVGAGPGFSDADGLWDGILTTPALGDIDGDGDLEIVVAGIDRRIHAWHHNGVRVDGWPISQWDGDALWRGGLSSPALGDLDGDGLPEVVVSTMSPYSNGEQDKNATLWAINGDSTNVPGFPIQTEQILHSSPALGDIDNDGRLEIVIGAGWGTPNRQNIVYAWNHDGTSLPNWPRETAGSTSAPPALGDIDGDGIPEVVIGCGNLVDPNCNWLYAWNADGNSVNGFPMQPATPNNFPTIETPLPYSPILADYDGDGVTEILVVHMAAFGFSVVEPNGITSDRSHYMWGGLLSPVVVDDVDNDGMLEVIAAGADALNFDMNRGGIQIWDENGSATSWLPWPTFHYDILRTGNIHFGDTTPPQNPIVTSSAHIAGVWSNNNVMQVSWSGASDDQSGLSGYFYAWGTSRSTEPGWDSPFASVTLNGLTSDPLTDGKWYFHLRAVDLAGNLASDTVHLGPFQIDTVPPVSRVTAPPCNVLSAAVSWDGWDTGSGVTGYDIKVRDGASGGWTTWINRTTAISGTYGIPGHTYYFRSRARDAAGNLEAAHTSADAHTRVTQYGFSGVVRNALEQPIFNALIETTPAAPLVTHTGVDGRYLLCYDTPGTYALTASHSGFGPLPAMQHLSGTVGDLDFCLPPADDVLVNGQFELGDLSGWSVSGPGVATVTDTVHTGYRATQLGGAGGSLAWSAALSQSVILSEALHAPTLSLVYRVGGNDTLLFDSPAWVAVQGSVQTLTHTLPTSVMTWSHVWIDLSVFQGQTVTVALHLDSPPWGSGWLVVDEVSLGTVVPGVRQVYLPIVSRQY